jgi:hypothetical protein
MSSKPLKRTGFAQGVFVQSNTKKETVGSLRILKDGRKFRYARAGAGAMAAGKMAVAADIAADVMNEAGTVIIPIGAYQIAETITSATYAEDFFAGGFFQVNDGTGQGHQYLIDSSTAVAGATAITLSLADPIRVATAASIATEFSIMHNPCMNIVESASINLFPVGISPMVVTATYYYWVQTGGMALGLAGNNDAVGKPVGVDTLVAGALSGADGASYYPQVAISLGHIGVATEYKPYYLLMD